VRHREKYSTQNNNNKETNYNNKNFLANNQDMSEKASMKYMNEK